MGGGYMVLVGFAVGEAEDAEVIFGAGIVSASDADLAGR